MTYRFHAAALLSGTLLAMAAPAGAVSFVETADAGVTIATAAVIDTRLTSSLVAEPGAANRIVISGNLSYVFDPAPDDERNADLDLYRFELATGGNYRFVATGSEEIDDNLLLFNALGQGLAGDDDNDGDVPGDFDSLDSIVQINLAAGTYYLGYGDNNIAAFVDFDALLAEDDFFDNDFGTLDEPTTERIGLIGAEFTGDYDQGSYTIFATAVPEPSTWAMLILGFGLTGFAMRRMKTDARLTA